MPRRSSPVAATEVQPCPRRELPQYRQCESEFRAEEQAGKIRIGKLNIDDNLDVTRRFEVMSIPTLILFKDGEVQKRIIGAKPKGQLLEEISAYL